LSLVTCVCFIFPLSKGSENITVFEVSLKNSKIRYGGGNVTHLLSLTPFTVFFFYFVRKLLHLKQKLRFVMKGDHMCMRSYFKLGSPLARHPHSIDNKGKRI